MLKTLCLLSLLLLMTTATADAGKIRVLVWDEQQEAQKIAYPNYLGNHIADHLKTWEDFEVKSVRLNDPEQGIPDSVLEQTDVLIWWGHVRHGDVKKDRVEKIIELIKQGKLQLIALHSAHWSQPFIRAMEERTKEDALKMLSKKEQAKATFEYVSIPKGLTKPTDPPSPNIEISEKDGHKHVKITQPSCVFPAVRADGKPSHVTVLDTKHPLTKGVPASFDIPQTEMYADPFTVPKPDLTLYKETWDKGETFHSGSVWKVGKGKVFYFRPGHETYPVFKQPETLRIVANAAKWLGK